jgi:tetratricopeptide (TPR) repeat protein
MNVPLHLSRLPAAAPAEGLLLYSDAAADVLDLCARLGADPLPRIHAVADGFLLQLPAPVAGCFPRTVRLRRAAPNVWVPADAELVPALLDDEANALGRRQGLVFLPAGRVLAFTPAEPLPLSVLVGVDGLERRAWQPLPAPRPLAERISEIVLEVPPTPLEDLLGPEDPPIAAEAPQPEDAGTPATAVGRAALGVGRGLLGLGNLLGLKGVAGAGARLIQGALALAPRLSESLLGRQEAALRALLREFREGNLERALRRALPLGEPGARGATPYTGTNLPTHNLMYSLGNLLGEVGGRAGVWFGGFDVQAELAREYRKAAEEAARRGDYRRAAFIYGKLLRDYRMAANLLLQGGLAHDAAVLYLNKVGDTLAAARAFEAAGEIDQAVQLYRRRREHVLAGDLLRRAGEQEAALLEYQQAAEDLVSVQHDYHAAGELLLTKAGRADLALAYFQAGWERRKAADVLPNIVPCGLRLARLYAQEESPAKLLALVSEADEFFAPPGNEVGAGEFYNQLACLAGQRHLAAVHDELRDRALLSLALKLRQRAEVEAHAGTLVGRLLGRPGGWSAALVSDAQLGVSRVLKRPAKAAPTKPAAATTTKTQIGTDTVTAACAAGESGEVFLGFQSGAVVCYRPQQDEVTRLPIELSPVRSLAVDREGSFLVTHQEGDLPTTFDLTSCERSAAGSYQLRYPPVVVRGAVALVPNVVKERGDYTVCTWEAGRLSYLRGFVLTPAREEEFPDYRDYFGGSLLLPPFHRPLGPATGLVFAGNSVWCQGGSVGASLGWTPSIPEGHPLRSVPLAWHVSSGDLEVAGLSQAGGLFWSKVEIRPDSLRCAATNASADEGYRAATIVRPGLVVGVKSARVHWLRCGSRGFIQQVTSKVSIPSAVACFPSHPTEELVVVCADGLVVRLPIPN